VLLFLSLTLTSCNNDSGSAGTSSDVNILISDSLIKHSYITNFYPGINFENDDDFAALAWIADTVSYIGRTLFICKLSVIPQNATVTNAQLLLSYDREPIHYTGAGHHQDSGSNACYMQRITQNWADSTVNWNTQPSVTTTNQISLDSSTSGFQNYSVDMTAVINDMVQNPSGNFGFLFRLKKESPLRVLGFSMGLRNPNLKPVLQVTYKIP